MSDLPDLGKFGPITVGLIVAIYLIALRPLSGELSGISLNFVGALLVLVGGVLGTFQ